MNIFKLWRTKHYADERNYKVFTRTKYSGEVDYLIKRKNMLGIWEVVKNGAKPLSAYTVDFAEKRIGDLMKEHQTILNDRVRSIKEYKTKKQQVEDYTKKL